MRTLIKHVLAAAEAKETVTVKGWVRTRRDSKGVSFLELNDGSCLANVQIIEANPAFVADVRKRTEPLVQDWIKSATAKGVDGAKAWAEYQDELKKVASGK